MHTITLKADDDFFANISNTALEYGFSKSELIRVAVMEYIEGLKSEQLQKQIARASMLCRVDTITMQEAFDESTSDGLSNV